MGSEVEKEKAELATFKLFAKHSQLKIIESSIENRKHPENYWKNIVDNVKGEFKKSSFQKLWFFDSVNEKILFEASKPK